MLEFAVLLIFPAAMAFAASSDLVSFRIPNYVSFVLIGGFAVLAPVTGMPLNMILMHIVVGVIVLVICFGLFAGNFIGGGDAKLLACTSLWFGWPLVMTFLIYTALFGGILAVVLITLRNRYLPIGLMKHEFVARLHEDGGPAPYGIAIAAAALSLYPASFWMLALAS